LGADPAAELAEGALKFRLAGARLTGGFMLKRLAEPPGRSAGGGGDENENGDGGGGRAWLLIKERDAGVRPPEETEAALAEEAGVALAAAPPPPRPGVAAPFPKRVAPQLPSPAPLPPEGPDWAHEIKHDGHRTLAFLQAGAPRFVTRGGLDWTARYGRLADVFADLDCADAVIDGEVVVQDAKGASSLDLLQQALRAGRDHEFLFFAFDLLHLDGSDLRAEPLALRKSWLRRLAPPNPYARLQYSEHTLGDGRALFAEACRLGLEGVVSKRLGARHQDGRSTGWIKAKRYDVGRFEVVGYTQKTSERFVSALILAEADAETGALRHVGRAGSGLGAEEARRLAAALEPRRAPEAALETPKIAHARWVAPGAMTAEIAYRGRSASGALKQPAVLRVFEAAEGSTPATGGGGAASPPARPRLVSDRDLAAIRLTNPDREILEQSGVTKLDVALYYARAGDWILPELLDRPVTLIRNPTGRRGDAFHQRHGFAGLPEGVEAVGPRETQHLVIRTARGFLALPQFGVLEFHPWDARAEDLERPDRLTFDLDPGEGVDWPTVRRAAEELRARLRAGGLTPFPRLTGGAGLHLVVPLAPEAGWAEAARFVKAAAAAA
ncbi:MAG: DNA ligase D, partial [Pseudomonadota bacterium]